MDLTQLSMITLAATVALIITSQFARRTTDPHSKLHLLRKVLAVTVLALAGVYFYMRITG